MSTSVGWVVPVFLVGCILFVGQVMEKRESQRAFRPYTLANGTKISCRAISVSKCGLHFDLCEDGKRYECQVNTIPGGD